VAVDAIVRVSFQSKADANQATNKALVGDPQKTSGPGPFQRVGTHAFSCSDGDDQAVFAAFRQLGETISQYYADLDFVSVSYVRRKDEPALSDET